MSFKNVKYHQQHLFTYLSKGTKYPQTNYFFSLKIYLLRKKSKDPN